MEYLESAKSRFENYLKKAREVPKTREGVTENLLSKRQTTREQLLTERRNISEDLIAADDIEDETTPLKDDAASPISTTSGGSTPEYSTPDETMNSSFQLNGTSYFHKTLNDETSRLTTMCKTWNSYKETNVNLSENAKDLIDLAVGQATLLITKKFQQFRKLIVAAENGNGERKRVTCEDLQGFWDMVYIQVENIDTKFNCLSDLKTNKWEETIPVAQQKIVKKVGNRKRTKSAATSSLRTAIEASRKNMKSASSIEDSVCDGDISPQKKPRTSS